MQSEDAHLFCFNFGSLFITVQTIQGIVVSCWAVKRECTKRIKKNLLKTYQHHAPLYIISEEEKEQAPRVEIGKGFLLS